MFSFFESFKQRARFFCGLSRPAEAIYAMLNRMYREPLSLAGFTLYSEHDEGIIAEIFRRIDVTYKQFIDFGNAEGIENDATYLAPTGPSGPWMDGGEDRIRAVQKHSQRQMEFGKLKVRQSLVTRENNPLIGEAGLDPRPDLLSIDIDGNDYWIGEAIDRSKPRSIIGASLKAIETLGAPKRYALVGCNFAGVKAFLVRNDLARGDVFSAPFTAERHHREAMYDAFDRDYSRHSKDVGPYISLADG